MSETNNKVTVRFESTVENRENDNTETLLLSGPIEIFATLDVIHTEYTVGNKKVIKAHPTSEEMMSDTYKITKDDVDNNIYPDLTDEDIGHFSIEKFASLFGNEIALESPYVTDLVYEYYSQTGKHPVIYVERVTNYADQYRNRGAYFRLESVSTKNGESQLTWREILLGTHSHSNINDLEKLYELTKQADVENKVIALDKNGEFCLVDMVSSQSLPPLPADLQEKIDAIKRYSELNEPLYHEWNHLDAPLDQLDNTYDWMEKDEDGNYKNLAIGNCRELYRNLLLSKEEKLYISDDYTLSDEGKYWISLDVYKVNFDIFKSYDDAVNAKLSSIDDRFFAAGLILSDNISNDDEVFILNNGKMLSDEHYTILERKQKLLSVLFNSADKQFKDICTVTVLIVRDAHEVKGFRTLLKEAFDNNNISLSEINNALIKKYIRNEFAKKSLLPKLYLSTDEYGNMVWDNKLLPSQTFYAETVRIDIAKVNKNRVVKNERDCVRVIFENANYRVGEDFPLLMVNDFFVFNVKPDIDESGKDIVYYLPISPISGEGQYDFDLIEPSEYRDVTLVLIKNSSAGSIADEIAEKYVSKEDAVSILSHGKINLKDFVKRTELIKFSKLDHLHSQYALKDHNHDARYANFHHTHPEILTAIERIYGSEVNIKEITDWLDDLDNRQGRLLDGILSDAGFVKILGPNYENNKDDVIYKIEDISVRLNSNSENLLREFSGKYNIPVPLTKVGLTVKDALEIIMRAFELDTVTDDQVLLEKEIPVRLINGPIGGISKNKVYKEGISLQQILQDIFNPYVSVDTMKEYLTPDEKNTILRWWRYDSSGELYEVNLDELQYSNQGTLLFTVELNNSENRNCKEIIVQNGISTEFEAVVSKVIINDSDAERYETEENKTYFIYDSNFDFGNDEQEMSEIKIVWKATHNNKIDDKVYDNYGENERELNPENKYLTFKPEISIDYPDYFYGGVDNIENILDNLRNSISGEGEYTVRYDSGEGINFKVDTSKTPVIVVVVEEHIYEDINIFDIDSRMNITKFFDELESDVLLFNEKKYVCFYYESLDHNSELNLSLSLNKCKIC